MKGKTKKKNKPVKPSPAQRGESREKCHGKAKLYEEGEPGRRRRRISITTTALHREVSEQETETLAKTGELPHVPSGQIEPLRALLQAQ